MYYESEMTKVLKIQHDQDRSYEIRRYEAAKWVTTIVVAFNEDKAKKTGYMRLFHYIRGANNRGRNEMLTESTLGSKTRFERTGQSVVGVIYSTI